MEKVFFEIEPAGVGCFEKNTIFAPVFKKEAYPKKARMAELVDAYVSGAYAARCAGSSPVPGTKERRLRSSFFYVF